MKNSYQVLLGIKHCTPSIFEQQVQSLQDRQVDGLMIMDPTMSADLKKRTNLLNKDSVPCVLVDTLPDVALPGVHTNRALGMKQLANHLVDKGHTDLLFVFTRGSCVEMAKWEGLLTSLQGELVSRKTRLRVTSNYQKGWLEAEKQDSLIIPKISADAYSDFDEEAQCYRKSQEIAKWQDRPGVVLCPSDILAMSFIRGFEDAGLKVPDDMAVTGFADSVVARYFKPGLTTVRQPQEHLAKEATNMMLSLLNGTRFKEEKMGLFPELVVRESA